MKTSNGKNPSLQEENHTDLNMANQYNKPGYKSLSVLIYTDIIGFIKKGFPSNPGKFPYAALIIMICMLLSYFAYFCLAICGDKSAAYFKLYVCLLALMSFILNFWSIIASLYAFFTAKVKILSLSIFIISLIIALIIISAFINPAG